MSSRPARRPASIVGALAVGMLLAVAGALAAPLSASAATVTVTDTNDDPVTTPGSLRWAVAQVASGDTITFDAVVTALSLTATVTLPIGVTLDGGGHVVLSPAPGMTDALLEIAPAATGQDYTIRRVELAGPGGGAISRGLLVVAGGAAPRNVVLSQLSVHDFAEPAGAGIDVTAVTGTLSIDASTLSGNLATGAGGSALSYTAPSGVALVISNTTISGNETRSSAVPADGAVSVEGSPTASVDIESDTFTSNLVGDVGGFTFILGGALSLGSDDGTSGALTIANSTFRGNGVSDGAGHVTAYLGGAVAASRPAAAMITGTTFDGNGARDGAGALFLDNMAGVVTMQNDVLTENGLSGGGNVGLAGGAYFANNSGVTTISGLTASHNAGGDGGALSFGNQTGTVSITSSLFTGNSAQAGGGVFFQELQADLTVDGSTFDDNTTSPGRRGIVGGSGIDISLIGAGTSLIVSDSTFTGNSFTGCACTETGVSIAVLDAEGDIGIEQSTFDETTSAVAIPTIQVGLVGSTFGLADSTVVGALGVDLGELDGTLARISHTIVEVPSGIDAITVDNQGSGPDLDVRWSLLSSGLGANETDTIGNQLATDAQLGALANNGGPTRTMLPLTGSPAIDTGDPAFSDPITLDQRGLPRIVRTIDIGAVEVQATAPTVLSATGVPIGGGLGAGILLLLFGAAVVASRVVARRRAVS